MAEDAGTTIDPAAARRDLADRCETVSLLAREAHYAAQRGDVHDLAMRMERLLLAQGQLERAYLALFGSPMPPGDPVTA
jgi:hypothetical protein